MIYRISILAFLICTLNSGWLHPAYGKILENRNDSSVSLVVIDPGHGGKDLGAVAGNVLEKDVVLELSILLGKMIRASFPETGIIFTRTSDQFVSLSQRSAIANEAGADLFISVHLNANGHEYIKGAEIYYHKPESRLFALHLSQQFKRSGNGSERDVQQSGFAVLRQIAMPGVLIEAGYLSNPEEREFIASEKGKEVLASVIFNALDSYKKSMEINPEDPDLKNGVHFSVQILALRRKAEVTPENFKGETRIFRRETDLNRYFSGRFASWEEANLERRRIEKKYPGAFIVAFDRDTIISVKKALENQ